MIKFSRIACLSAFLLISIAGCRQPVSEPLRVGTSTWQGYAPIHLAQSLNYFEKGSVEIIDQTSSTDLSKLFIGGKIDAATLTLDEAITLAQFTPDVSIVLVIDVSNGADVLLARPEIKELKGLKGKRVGVETTAVGAYMLARAIDKAALNPDEINVIHMDMSKLADAYRKGEVDAIITYEPIRTKVLAAGAVKLFDSSQIPGEIVDVLVVRKDYLRANAPRVSHFLDCWFKATAYNKSRPREAAELMKARLGLSADEVVQSFFGLRIPERPEVTRMLAGENPGLLETTGKLNGVMIEHAMLHKKIDIADLFERKTLEALYR